MKRGIIIEYVGFVLTLVFIGLIFWGLNSTKEPEIVHPEPLNEPQDHVLDVGNMVTPPDPCGLNSVICDGEIVSHETTVTAYTSYANQTDSSPCISADGTDICERYSRGENICATNDFHFGTTLFIGGDFKQRCTVADRMNSRYTGTGRVDIYMGYDTEAAMQWGVRQVNVKQL